ncbi:MAG TPA: hypothetical protein DIW47_08535 [Bacteroidetes bacterium]|nr:hypothetical protein [Bacteroidota bacterium]
MKQIFSIVLTILFSCKVPGDKAFDQKLHGDSFNVFLTNDIAINSCLLSWEKLEAYTLRAAVSGDLDVFETPFSKLIPREERARSFSFKAMDQRSGKEQLIPMEKIEFQRIKDGFKLIQTSPFDGSELICGYVKTEDLIQLSPADSRLLLSMFVRFEKLPALNKTVSGSEIYTSAMLLLDTLQKDLAYQAEVKMAYSCLDENLNKMDDKPFREKIHQLEDSLGTDGLVYSKKVRIPEYDLWKGFMAYGSLSNTQLSWNAFGLLYHPDTKFGSFNPGKILWFAVPTSELEKQDADFHHFLSMVAKNALLYSADPGGYTSQYYLNNSIRIDNGRYPGKR